MDSVRLDKWLWAARFFKTRSMAREAVAGGKVRLNGSRAKPAKPLHAGDELRRPVVLGQVAPGDSVQFDVRVEYQPYARYELYVQATQD